MSLFKFFVLLVCLACSISVQSQGKNADEILKRNSISGNILGTASYVGLSYERVIGNRTIVEVGLGLIGFGAGVSVYARKLKPNVLSPYIGLKFTTRAMVDLPLVMTFYLPIGLTFFSKHNVNIGFDIGPSYDSYLTPGYTHDPVERARYPYSDFGVFGNVKLGIAF
jgi:hypothetical protein